MSDELLSSGYTPTSDNPGAGVKRLTKLPFLIIGGIFMLVLLAVMYAFIQRSSANEDKESTQNEQVIASSNTGYKALISDWDTEPGWVEPAVTEPEPVVAQRPPPAPVAPVLPQEPQLSSAERQRIERGLAFREDTYYDAVVAETSIGFGSSSAALSAGDASPAALLSAMTGGGGVAPVSPNLQSMLLGPQLAGGTSAPLTTNTGGAAVMNNEQDTMQQVTQLQNPSSGLGYSHERRTAARTPYELAIGTFLPAIMMTGINSELPGLIKAQISEDVRDTRTGKYVLIPRGAQVVGRYDSQIQRGQERVMVVWDRIRFPDGSYLNLGGMSGVDTAGYSGVHDLVDNHYWRTFGNATLLSFISAAGQLSQPESDGSEKDAGEELAAELGRQWGQVGQEMTRRNMNIQPTLIIRTGYRFNIMVNKDLILSPYEPWPSQSDG